MTTRHPDDDIKILEPVEFNENAKPSHITPDYNKGADGDTMDLDDPINADAVLSIEAYEPSLVAMPDLRENLQEFIDAFYDEGVNTFVENAFNNGHVYVPETGLRLMLPEPKK